MVLSNEGGDPLRDYMGHFNKEKVSIINYNPHTAISLFRKGLHHDSDLYKELTKYPYRTMTNVLEKAWAQIKWEKDKANYYYSFSSYSRKKSPRDGRIEEANLIGV